MRVNTKVFDERIDLFSELYVKNCPSQFEATANHVLNLITKPGYSVGDYHTMSQLDKILMVDYWKEYDGMIDALTRTPGEFTGWFIKSATSPELIRRSRQWLTEHNYIFVNSDVAEHAQEAGTKFRHAVRG